MKVKAFDQLSKGHTPSDAQTQTSSLASDSPSNKGMRTLLKNNNCVIICSSVHHYAFFGFAAVLYLLSWDDPKLLGRILRFYYDIISLLLFKIILLY